ncbi:AraC family transcriptional regulator ligand-binding domain-containing protein [Novosphingobium sp. BL-8A]|uniref:AraC family transcriptional regulator ligand-binding domain-containing protein n=1 Tax=Novosphingobium sp. BL-8A TaxID=3127639 RepID=UPI0037567A24
MDHAHASHVLRARLLRHFPALVRELGGCPEAMLDDVGLVAADCDREGTASYEQWIWLMERAARDLATIDFGMRLAVRQQGDGVYGKLGTAMRNSRTFGEATTHAVIHNSAHSLAARVWKEATASGRHVFLGHDVLVEAMPNRCQAVEQLLLLGHLGAMAITGGRVRAREVHFRHRNLAPARAYRRYFGCDVRFCCTEDGVAFRAEDMACPILDPDAETLAAVIAQIRKSSTRQRPTVSTLVRGMVMQRLWTSKCGSEDVARLLAMHPRTLHRRLRDEGSSFQRIKDEVRCDHMLYYLERTELELGAISHKLGFSEQSALSHFARHMLDASPSDLRARAARGAAPIPRGG